MRERSSSDRVQRRASPRPALFGVLVATALAAGCAVELENVKPSQEIARRALPDGDVHVGWRVYQQKCATCHGDSAGGSASAPDLLSRLRDTGPHRFVDLVLKHHEHILSPADSPPDGDSRDARVERILQGREAAMVMPAWQGNPTVTAHIIDLYAYLAARADGSLASGRPAP